MLKQVFCQNVSGKTDRRLEKLYFERNNTDLYRGDLSTRLNINALFKMKIKNPFKSFVSDGSFPLTESGTQQMSNAAGPISSSNPAHYSHHFMAKVSPNH